MFTDNWIKVYVLLAVLKNLKYPRHMIGQIITGHTSANQFQIKSTDLNGIKNVKCKFLAKKFTSTKPF